MICILFKSNCVRDEHEKKFNIIADRSKNTRINNLMNNIQGGPKSHFYQL